MLYWSLFWLVVAIVVVGQALLIHAAWRFRRASGELPPGVPRSQPYGDLAWTLATALATFVVLFFVYGALS